VVFSDELDFKIEEVKFGDRVLNGSKAIVEEIKSLIQML
jgi:hypothetical protein